MLGKNRMSLLPNIVYANPTVSLWASNGTVSGTVSSFVTLNASSITTSTVVGDFVSAITIDANDLNVSTMFAYEIFIDNQGLTAAPGELLLNGIPLLTTSNLSSVAEWSKDPAIQDVRMDGFNLVSTNIVDANVISSSQGIFSSIYAPSIVCENLTALSSIHSFNYTSSTHLVADDAQISSINGINLNGFVSSVINPSSNVSQWATYPAVADVDINDKDIKNANLIEFYELNRTSLLGGTINAGDIQCDNLTVGNSTTNLADVAIYGVNALPGDNALYVEGGTTLTGGGIVHGVTIGALQVGGIDTVRIDVLPAGMGLNSATYIQLAAAGAGSFAAGGALSLAGGDYVEINTGEIQCINTTSGQSWLSVNNVQGNTHNGGDGTLQLHDVTMINDFPISYYQPISSYQTLETSSFTVSSINGQQLAEIGGSNWSFYDAFNKVNVNNNDIINVANIAMTDTISWTGVGATSISGGQVASALITTEELDVTNVVYANGPNAQIINFSTIQGDYCQFNRSEIDALAAVSVRLGTSTILTSEPDFPGMTVRQFNDYSIAQANASAFTVGDPVSTFQGAYTYSIANDRAVVINSSIQTKYIAYLDDLQFMSTPSALSTNTISTAELYVSSVNNQAPFGNKYILSINSSNKQTVLGVNTLTPLDQETELINIGGFTNTLSTFTVPVGGIYSIQTSIQFSTSSGGTRTAYFWLMKNGSNVPDSASIVSITKNGETLGNITLFDNAVAGDQYSVVIESADTNMAATSFPAGGNISAIPSVITNVLKVD